MIDEEYHPKGTMIESDNNIRAFDLENNGWRSFNFDTVKEAL
jgi:predicted DNA-binding transcriptional regulator YafY